MSEQVNKDDVARIIVLARGLMERGGFYWCYVAVKPSRYEEFKQKSTQKYNIQNFVKDGYGEVIVSSSGREPPKDVTETVAHLFDVPASSLFTDSNPEGTITSKFEDFLKAQAG